MPLPTSTTSAARARKLLLPPLLFLPHRPPPLPPLDQLRPLPHNRRETGILSRGEALGPMAIRASISASSLSSSASSASSCFLSSSSSLSTVLVSGVVCAVSATKRRHRKERSAGSHETDHGCHYLRPGHLRLAVLWLQGAPFCCALWCVVAARGRSDRLLLVSPPRAQSSLRPTLSSSHHGLPAGLSQGNEVTLAKR